MGSIDMFQLDPLVHFTEYGGPGQVDVVAVLQASTGVPLGIVKHHSAPLSAYDLTTGLGVSVGGNAPQFDNTVPIDWGNPKFMSDSVQATSSRAIGLTNRTIDGADGYVGIVDLTGTLTAQTFGFSCAPYTVCQTHPAETVHDVAVTPDGVHGIVSGNGVFGVYKLNTMTEAYKVINHVDLPHMKFVTGPLSRVVIDSVEATNRRAVIIGKDLQNSVDMFVPNFPMDTAKWRVTIVDLRASQTGYSHVSFTDNSANIYSRAHDVAITPSGAMAVVTTRAETLLIGLTDQLQLIQPKAVVTGADPLEYPTGTAYSALVSDSVAVTNTQAVVIGRTLQPSSRARIAVINLRAPPPAGALTTFDFVDVPNPVAQRETWLPTDVVIDPSGQHAIVRLVDVTLNTLVTPPVLMFPTRGRLVVIDLVALQITLDQTSAPGFSPSTLGMAQGYDQVECSLTSIVTAGADMSTQSAGWWQVLTLQ